MKVTPVDSRNNLFIVEDVYSKELIQELLKEDLTRYIWESAGLPRRRNIKFNHGDIFYRLNQHLRFNLSTVAQSIGVDLLGHDSMFWQDEPGFWMGIHEDNCIADIVMQVYLSEADAGIGTKFYDNLDGSILRYDAPYKINTGWLSINGPRQYHGATAKVPDDSLRLSSYTYFYRNLDDGEKIWNPNTQKLVTVPKALVESNG